MITIQTDTGELQGHDFISRLFCGTVNWFGHLMSDIAGSSGGRGNANGGRGSGIVIPFYELFGLCDFGSFQVGENRNTLAVLATKAFQDGYDARWGLTMAIPVVLCDLSIRFIWSVRRFFGDKKQLSECIPSDKQPDLRMMVLVGNGTLCIVDGVDAAVRSGGNMLVFFMHLNLIAWYKLVKRVLAELIIRYDLSYADLAVYIEKINQELNQQLQVLRAIDYDAYEKELAQINTISGLLDDKQTCTDKIYQKLNEMRVNKRKVAEGIKSVSMMNYDAERKKLETTQDETNKRLAELGQLKLKAWGEGYPRFCEMYSKVKLPPNSNGEVALEGDLSITPEDLSEFRTLGIGIKEAMQTGATGYAVGMLAGFAAQSGATSMAIFASTGTAISSLSGAAATNATLAQLGGGALSAGGLGMAGGQAVLTGLKAAPLLMVEGILFNIKGNKVLENAKDIEYQTFKAVGKMQDIEIELKRLALLSKSVQDELQQLYDVYLRLVAQAEKTVERTTEYVNFTAAEKLNFQKTCLAIKLISVLSKQDLLDEAKEGEMNKVLDKETKETIQKVHQAAGDGKLLVA